MATRTEVTRKKVEEILVPPREGVYLHGLFLHGALWNAHAAALAPVVGPVIGQPMGVLYVKAALADKEPDQQVRETRGGGRGTILLVMMIMMLTNNHIGNKGS